MPWKYTDEYYKNYTKETWDACAEKYLPVMNQLMPFHSQLLKQITPQQGQHILDICTGPGEPAMTIASMVAPKGHVTGIDLSKNMIDIASKNAKKRKLRNVEFVKMDAEKLDLDAKSFNVTVSCFGFQIITDPHAAANEIFRVLKSGGRVGLTVWSTGDKVPAIDVLVGPMMEHAEPDETGYLPTPYELGGRGELTGMLKKVGFKDAKETRVNGTWKAANGEEYLNMIIEGTPLGHSLHEEEPQVQKEVLRKTRANIKRYETPEGIMIPAECVIVTAKKP